MVASRWLDDEWFPNIVEGFFHIAPKPLRSFVARQARKQMQQTYHLQGLGRHSRQEQGAFARCDLQALQDVVSGEGFLFAAQSCVLDFTIASFMAGVYDQQPPTWNTHLANDYSLSAFRQLFACTVE